MNPLFELFEGEIVWPDVYENEVWFTEDGYLLYNLKGNSEDLLNGDGETYSGEIRGEPVQKEGYVIYNLDSGCGYDYQAIFKLENKW